MTRAGFASLAAGAWMLASVPADASTLYTNGPVDGTHNAWALVSGFAVADSFDLSFASTLAKVDFATWHRVDQIDWEVLSASPGVGGNVLSAGTSAVSSTFLFGNDLRFSIFEGTFALPDIALAPGTYWLELQNAVVANGGTAGWDMNGGPSHAWQSFFGNVTPCDTAIYPTGWCSSSFDIQGTAVPEPASLALIAVGLAALGAVRRKTLIR